MDDFKTYNGKGYRFLSFDGLKKTIVNQSLRYTNVTALNDPLDCSPILYPKIGISLEEYEIHLPNLKEAIKPMFVCCFCKEYDTLDSFLMWSHYANSHTQVAFEVDFSVQRIVGNPSEVGYPESLLDERNRLSETQRKDIGLFIVTNKLKQWSYEQEVRLVIDSTSPNYTNLGAQIDGDHLYIDFNPESISKIIFGVNSNPKEEREICQLFDKYESQPTFEKMYIDPSDLLLKSKEYKRFTN